jgi:ketosteroid isomerase-like protein
VSRPLVVGSIDHAGVFGTSGATPLHGAGHAGTPLQESVVTAGLSLGGLALLVAKGGCSMGILERFMAYARDFERTFRDDDWSRLAQYFAPDATYEVQHSPFACCLQGRDAIFRGIKQSLDGFDRKFATRSVGVTAPPAVEGDTVTIAWTGTYERPGAPPLTIRGRTVARYAGDLITNLSDSYADDNAAETLAWMRAHGVGVNFSYV